MEQKDSNPPYRSFADFLCDDGDCDECEALFMGDVYQQLYDALDRKEIVVTFGND